MTTTILGLPVEQELPSGPDYSISPISAITVFKGIDSDGDEVHSVIMTEGTAMMEGVAMAHFGSMYMDELLKRTFKAKKK